MRNPIKLIIILISLFAITSINGCSKSRLLTVFKTDIQQGNAVEPEKVDKLQIGMSKEQVEFLLGTPLLVDAFHSNRWDYIYFLLPGFGERERRHLTLIFDGDLVAEILKKEIPPVAPEETTAESETTGSEEES